MNKQGKRKAAYDKKYNATKKQKKRRASRNKARRLMTKKYGKAKMRGKDVDHKDGNPLNNSKKNLRLRSKSKNRANKK